MELAIKVWPNQAVSLVTAEGYTLSTFDNIREAEQVRQAWYEANGLNRPHSTPAKPTPPLHLI
jgi:hypothetical protein